MLRRPGDGREKGIADQRKVHSVAGRYHLHRRKNFGVNKHTFQNDGNTFSAKSMADDLKPEHRAIDNKAVYSKRQIMA